MTDPQQASSNFMLIKLALERIRQDCDAKRQNSIHGQLTRQLQQLKAETSADFLWPLFKQILLITNASDDAPAMKLKETTLDWMQKLLSQQVLSGGEVVKDQQQPEQSAPASKEESASGSSSVMIKSYPMLMIDDMIHSICMASPPFLLQQQQQQQQPSAQQSLESALHLQIIKCLLTACTSPVCHVHEHSLLKAVQACVNIYLYSGNTVNQMTAKAGLMQICHFVTTRMESFMEENALVNGVDDKEGGEGDFLRPTLSPDHHPYFATEKVMADLLRRDSFYLLRYLCRLSMKLEKSTAAAGASGQQQAATVLSPQSANMNAGVDELSPILVKTRALAMEMLLSLLTNAGRVQQQEPFISLIRQYVTLAISKNGLSTVPQLFELSLSVFLILFKNFKQTLKAELEVLFHEIYLYVLENPHAMFKQKSMVLQGLYKLCANPQILVDLYLNYDCDMAMQSIYEKTVMALSKLAESHVKLNSGASGKNNAAMVGVGVFGVSADDPALMDGLALEERRLRFRALRCLTAISISLSNWMKETQPGSTTSAASDMLSVMQQQSSTQSSPTKSPGKTGSSSGEHLQPESNGSSPLKQGGESLVLQTSAPNGTAAPSEASIASSLGTSPTDSGVAVVKSPENRSLPPSTAVLNPPVLVYKNPLHSVSMGDLPPAAGSGVQPHRRMDSTAEASVGHDVPRENPEDFERVKARKLLMKQGIAKFNESPSKGIAFLQENGFFIDDHGVVKFLRQTPELNKTSIGDYIGEGKEYNIKIMHLFVESFNFTNSKFVTALRHFLQAFRLPGEAQKIDRIMESFSARYCSNNPQVFAKADVAYTLAFSIMMLNTDQHSTRIKNRMTLQDFIKNNRGINDNSDLPDDLLVGIFEDISKNEIVMEEERTVKELEKMTQVGLATSSRDLERKRRELFRRETKHAEKKSQNLMKKGKDKAVSPFKSATHIEHARPMFDLFCDCAVSVLLATFEECNADSFPIDENSKLPSEIPNTDSNIDILTMCLMTIQNGIRIASLFRMEAEREAFMSALGKMTLLTDLVKMKAKNVAATRILISAGSLYGNYLEESWRHVLKCISEVDRLQLVSDRSRLSEASDNSKSSPVKSAPPDFPADGGSTRLNEDVRIFQTRRPSLGKLIKELQAQSIALSIDKIFASSASLDGSSIIHFYRAMCQVSQEEVESSRIYMLQKVIELSYYNMGRIRLEWSQIWKILLTFFNNVGCHENVTVATYAVDSLRQLGMKFLERSELAYFHTHNEFMKPLEYVIRHSKFSSIKELVIRSLAQMVAARAANIKSGWKSIFVILSRTASELNDEPLVRRSFDLLTVTQEKYWPLITEYFVDYVTCLVDFTFVPESISVSDTSPTPKIAEVALQLLLDCTRRLSLELKAAPEDMQEGLLTDDVFYLKWFPLLSGLTRIVIGSLNSDIRSKALDTFFEILKRHGYLFSFDRKHWGTVIKSVIMPLFEDLKEPGSKMRNRDERNSAENVNGAIWIQTIRRTIEVITLFFVPDSSRASTSTECFGSHLNLIELVLDLMVLLTSQNSDNLAQTGIIYLNQFIQQNMNNMDENAWSVVLTAIERVFKATIPVELLRFPVPSSNRQLTDVAAENEAAIIASIDVGHAILKCAIHLMVLQFVRDLALDSDDEACTLISGVTSSVPAGSQGARSPMPANGVALPNTIKTYPSKILLSLSKKQQARLLACLHASYVYANNFNSNYDLRLALWKAEVVKQMPNLIKQETQAISTYISILFHIFRANIDNYRIIIPSSRQQARRSSVEETQETALHKATDDPESTTTEHHKHLLEPSGLEYRFSTDILKPLLSESVGLLERYIQFLSDVQKYQRDITSWSLVVILLWKEILAVPWGTNKPSDPTRDLLEFKQHIPKLFRLAIKMMGVDRLEVRLALQSFLERIANLIDRDSFIKEL